MDVHLRELRAFVAVAEELHVTRAAARLFVSQPSLSRQVAALERAVRTPLLRRGARGVTLTAAGEALLPAARAVLGAWEQGQRDVAEAAAREAAELTVGLATGVGRGLLPAVARSWDAARLRMRLVGWSDPTVGLADRAVDVAFAFLPLPEEAGLAWEVLRREPRQVALPAVHRLAGRERLTMADLAGERFLALPSEPGRSYWLAVSERGGREAVVAADVETAEETFEAVAGGAGVALVARGNGELYAREGVALRDVDGLAPAELVVAWRADETRPLVRSFVAACVRVAGG